MRFSLSPLKGEGSPQHVRFASIEMQTIFRKFPADFCLQRRRCFYVIRSMSKLVRLTFLLVAACLARAAADEDPSWFAFNPPNDPFRDSAIDLRGLNETFAGEHGVIATRGDEFIFSAN